jgi:hypothetical protein
MKTLITLAALTTASSAFAVAEPANIADYWMPQEIKLKATAIYSDDDNLVEKGDENKGSEKLETTKVSITEKDILEAAFPEYDDLKLYYIEEYQMVVVADEDGVILDDELVEIDFLDFAAAYKDAWNYTDTKQEETSKWTSTYNVSVYFETPDFEVETAALVVTTGSDKYKENYDKETWSYEEKSSTKSKSVVGGVDDDDDGAVITNATLSFKGKDKEDQDDYELN